MGRKYISDAEKMFTYFAARGADDSVSVKDKIRYTEEYLHSMRMGTSAYSPERERYLENYLAELKGIEKKEAAAKSAVKKDTGNTVKLPTATPSQQPKLPFLDIPRQKAEPDTFPWKISYEIEDGYDYRYRSPQKTDPVQFADLVNKTLKESDYLFKSGWNSPDAFKKKLGSLTETASRAKSMKDYLNAHPDEFTKAEHSHLNGLMDKILKTAEPVASAIAQRSNYFSTWKSEEDFRNSNMTREDKKKQKRA